MYTNDKSLLDDNYIFTYSVIVHNNLVLPIILSIMQVNVLRDVAQCSLVETDRRFRGAYYPHHQLP
jgi:hypothetical protein